jgi:acyl carrier protein
MTQSHDTDRTHVEQVILDLLRAKLGGQPRREDALGLLNVDSVALAELSLEIEQALHVRMDEGVLEAVTVGEMIDYVAELRGRQHNSPQAPSY